ncbi:MAG TPA: tryptophan synthase subunit alpha [Anaeromyxobacteraceae bacterium]|nr:tryptophan synthase subunit alpha [Anaeromyxobacteraceae bacterium]
MTGLDRTRQAFARARERGEAALVTYVMAGDPDLATSRAMALACAEGGADVIELGMPFSDPIADGRTIQAAGERALAAGTGVESCLRLAAEVRRGTGAAIALMGYVNPILAYGEARFLDRCAAAGVDAVIVPDLPPEEAVDFRQLAAERGVANVFLLAPTSTEGRVAEACAAATGFVYFVSVTGVTGARRELPPDLAAKVAAVRARSAVPVVVGFGVSSPAQAAEVGRLADGVVVGSAIVERVARGGTRRARADRVRRFVAALKRSLRPGPSQRVGRA